MSARSETWIEVNEAMSWLLNHTKVLTIRHVDGNWSIQFYLLPPSAGGTPERAIAPTFSGAVEAALDSVLLQRRVTGRRGGES